jgi:hypothetical protein
LVKEKYQGRMVCEKRQHNTNCNNTDGGVDDDNNNNNNNVLTLLNP